MTAPQPTQMLTGSQVSNPPLTPTSSSTTPVTTTPMANSGGGSANSVPMTQSIPAEMFSWVAQCMQMFQQQQMHSLPQPLSTFPGQQQFPTGVGHPSLFGFPGAPWPMPRSPTMYPPSVPRNSHDSCYLVNSFGYPSQVSGRCTLKPKKSREKKRRALLARPRRLRINL
jgi:hypothetical protein